MIDLITITLISLVQIGFSALFLEDYIVGNYYWAVGWSICISGINYLVINSAIEYGKSKNKEGRWVK